MTDNYIPTDTKYNRGVMLNEYQGEWSIVSAYEKQDGTIGVEFGSKEVGKEKKKVNLPLAGRLGDRKQAADILRTMLAMLEDKPSKGNSTQDEDVPF